MLFECLTLKGFDMNVNMNVNSFSVEFNTVVENVKNIVRESRHMDIDSHLYEWLTNVLVKYLDDVNFNMEFVDDYDTYVHSHLLDMMDTLKDARDDEHAGENSNEYKVLNSIYDVVREFYFNN